MLPGLVSSINSMIKRFDFLICVMAFTDKTPPLDCIILANHEASANNLS